VFKQNLIQVCIGKHLCYTFPIQDGLEWGHALLPLLFNFALEYGFTKVQDNQERLELNRTYQFLLYVDDVNLLDKNVIAMKERLVWK
jgi:hypothetical protein